MYRISYNYFAHKYMVIKIFLLIVLCADKHFCKIFYFSSYNLILFMNTRHCKIYNKCVENQVCINNLKFIFSCHYMFG